MLVVLKQEVYHIKNGFAAHSPELGITAHGYSPEVARCNLERAALMFLKPFERQGKLVEEIQLLGVKIKDDGAGLKVEVIQK